MTINKEVGGVGKGESPLAARAPRTHLNAPEDAVGVYSVLGATEDGRRVVITLVPCAVAAKKAEQGSAWPTGAIWKCASAATGVFSKSSQDKAGCLPPSTGAILEAGPCEGWSWLSTLPSPHRLGLCLPQTSPEKSQWQDFIPSKLFTISMAERTAATISGMSRCLKFTSSTTNFCRHLMTQFLPDSTKKGITQEGMSHPQKWGSHICDPTPLILQISFPDQLYSSQPTPAIGGHWIIFLQHQTHQSPSRYSG